MFNKRKSGFTIVELLAVIVILAMVMVLSFSAVTGSSRKVNEKIFETKKSNIESAAIMYGQDKYIDIIASADSNDGKVAKKEIKVIDLVNYKYLVFDEDNKVTDPRGKYESLNDCKINIIISLASREVSANFINCE